MKVLDKKWLDKIDSRLLLELDHDGRMPCSLLGKKLNISKEVANYRIKRLMDNGIITGFHTVVDYGKLGFTNYKVYLKLKRLDNEALGPLFSFCRQCQNISWLHRAWEDVDVVINVNEKRVEDFWKTYNRIVESCSGNLLQKAVAITVSIAHLDHGFLEQKSPDMLYKIGGDKIGGRGKSIPLSKKEEMILGLMAKDGRTPLVDMAKIAKMKPTTMLYALRRLKKSGVILGVRPTIDYGKLGLSWHKVIVKIENRSRMIYQKVITLLMTIKGVIFITEVIADQDLEFEVLCRDQGELIELINLFRSQFPQGSISCRTRLLLGREIINYVPVFV